MKYIIGLFLIGLFLHCTACGQHTNQQEPAKNELEHPLIPDSVAQNLKKQKEELAQKMSTAQITYFVIRVPEEKFGYSIFIDGQLYIEQKSIPAIQGEHGFATKEDAEKIAKLAIEKIKQGEMPPTVSIEELNQLNIIIKP